MYIYMYAYVLVDEIHPYLFVSDAACNLQSMQK